MYIIISCPTYITGTTIFIESTAHLDTDIFILFEQKQIAWM